LRALCVSVCVCVCVWCLSVSGGDCMPWFKPCPVVLGVEQRKRGGLLGGNSAPLTQACPARAHLA
jgi:hypothetical protein